MTTNVCLIPACDNPADDRFMCGACAHTTQRNLSDLSAWIIDDLLTELTKQTKVAQRFDSRTSSNPSLPFNEAASDANTKLVRLLMNLADHVQQAILPDPKALAKHLSTVTHQVALHDQATVTAGELNDHVHQIKKLIDLPPTTWYAGKCSQLVGDVECPTELYATFSTGYITCPKCKTVHDIQQRRDYLIDTAKNLNVTASEAAKAIQLWTDIEVESTQKLVNRIVQWSRRGRLMERGHILENNQSRPLYKLEDVLNLMTQHFVSANR